MTKSRILDHHEILQWPHGTFLKLYLKFLNYQKVSGFIDKTLYVIYYSSGITPLRFSTVFKP